ncbi:hypothetical protein EGW08_019967, partial [Elysia chlorotica]
MADMISYGLTDYIVGGLTLLVPMIIGTWYAIKDAGKVTREEYLLGGRQMSVLPVTLSTFITFVSAITLIGIPAETFFFGGIVFSAFLGIALSHVIGYFTIVPLLHPLRLTSVYEYLQLRYESEAVRMLSAIIGMATNLLYQSVVLLSPALALQACARLPLWVSIALIGSIGTLYTAIGGFKSVVWTDVFQTVIVFVGMFVIIIKACIEVGGIGEVWRLSREGGRLDLVKFSVDPRTRHTQWSLIIGFVFMKFSHHFDQASVQRISSLRSLRAARRMFLLNAPLQVVYGAMNVIVGLATYAYYAYHHCDPYEAGYISNRNQLAPYFVLHALTDTPGLAGLFMGVLCCGSLSSLSSGINAMAANTVQDILSHQLQNMKEKTITIVTKLFVVAYGALVIGAAYLANSMDGPVTQLAASVFGALGSPVVAIILMGACVPWANKCGALAGATAALAFNLWMSLGCVLHGTPPRPLPSISPGNCSGLDLGSIDNKSMPSRFQGVLEKEAINVSYNGLLRYDTSLSTPSYQMDEIAEDGRAFFLYDVSYEWYALIGCVVGISVGLAISFLSTLRFDGSKRYRLVWCPSYTTARYIFPCLKKFWLRKDRLEGNIHRE